MDREQLTQGPLTSDKTASCVLKSDFQLLSDQGTISAYLEGLLPQAATEAP
jgi:hypothetical protein